MRYLYRCFSFTVFLAFEQPNFVCSDSIGIVMQNKKYRDQFVSMFYEM